VAQAQQGALVMPGTIGLRMLSFSMIDKLLYGPFKLNWIGDIGSAVLVGGCALAYCFIVIAPPGRSKPGGPA
jgi:hypothetical protein